MVVLERGFSKKQLLQFQKDYSVKLEKPPKYQLAKSCDENFEHRALIVIKTSPKSRAKTSKGAILNWKVRNTSNVLTSNVLTSNILTFNVSMS